MKLKKMKIILTAVCAVLMLGVMLLPCFAETDADDAVLSYGLNVLSAATDVALSAPVGNDIVFSQDAMARGLNLSKVDYITVKTLPPTTAGELCIGSSRVVAGQVITGEQLSYLTFSPAIEDALQTGFTFSANANPTPMLCSLYITDRIHYTPTVSMAPSLSLSLTTYKGLCAYERLSAYDPDGDALTFEIVSYPENGAVRLTDAALGNYVYTPKNGYIGTDRFSYVARDRYGNYSSSATVEVRVLLSGTSPVYVDMLDSEFYNDAITVSEANVMSGSQIGSDYYFHPKQTLTKAEFLVMAMHAVGVTNVPECDKTVFADDDQIADSMRGYVAAAYELGYVSGTLESGKLYFEPDKVLTKADAAVMLGNIVGLSTVAVTPAFSDDAQIPVWAADAIYSLNAVGILTAQGDAISPVSELTREQGARLLAKVMEYVD